jgi:DNA end-binding protein Ku
MPARAIGSGTISFGLVSIPIRFYVATSSKQVAFNMLHEECGSRIKQQLYCPKDERVVGRDEIVKGYEVAKDRYVVFTDEELKTLEVEANRSIDIQEFVPLEQVDPVYFDGTHYLGPDKGAEKAYHLLTEAMQETKRVALAQIVTRGKEELVLIRPFDGGLAIHGMHYADEIRSFDEIETGGEAKVRANEAELARKLVQQLSSEDFEPEKYQDEYRQRVEKLVQKKTEGEEITVAEEEKPRAQVIDLMEALKKSLAREPRAPERPAAAKEAADKRRPAAAVRRRETQPPRRRAQKK